MCADITSYSAQGRRVADLLSNLFKTFMIQNSIVLTSNNLRISEKLQKLQLFLALKKERIQHIIRICVTYAVLLKTYMENQSSI